MLPSTGPVWSATSYTGNPPPVVVQFTPFFPPYVSRFRIPSHCAFPPTTPVGVPEAPPPTIFLFRPNRLFLLFYLQHHRLDFNPFPNRALLICGLTGGTLYPPHRFLYLLQFLPRPT